MMLHQAFIHDDFFFLEQWMEIRGKLNKISENDYCLYLDIDNKVLEFKKESTEALLIQNILDESSIGKEIAILKTDLQDKPIIIHFISKKG